MRQLAVAPHLPYDAAMPKASARKANDKIFSLINGRYFSSIPLDQLYEIVENAGFEIDPEQRACILTGRDGRATWDLADASTHKSVNHMLVLHWHKMDTSGKYELTSYVS